MPHERGPDQRGREELAGELAAVLDRYRALFETLPFGVIRYSADGLILEANPAASQIMGCRTAEQTCVAVRTFMVGTEPRADDLCMIAVRLDRPT